MPRFVILRHELPSGDARGLHWDLMLESGETLRTWALAEEPLSAAEIAAQQLPDHRLAYLDYEGPVSGDRGTVARWDWGEFRLTHETSDRLEIRLCGARLKGLLTLERDAVERHSWRVSFGAEPMSG